MNDLELMLMLEEYGYEPSIENVKFLKEDLGLLAEDYLDEGVRDAVKTYFDHADNIEKRKQEYKNAVRTNRAANQGVKDAEKYVGSHAEHDAGGRLGDALDVKEKTQADVSASKQALKIARDRRRNAVGNALRNEPVRRNEEVPMKELVKPSTQMMTTKNDHKSSTALPDKKKEDSYGKVAVNAGVEYSDYELYQLLDESGYKPTEKNLYLLKEGLESGKYEILTEGPLKNAVRNIRDNIVKTKVAKKSYENRLANTNRLQNLDLLKPGQYAERMAQAEKQKEDVLATRVPLKDIFTNPDKNKKD